MNPTITDWTWEPTAEHLQQAGSWPIFRWPDESVCGLSYCPKLGGTYCCECHVVAYNALQRVRAAILITCLTEQGIR